MWRDSKNCVLDKMEGVTELNLLLRSPGDNPYRIMTQCLTQELQQTVAEMEVEIALSTNRIYPSMRTDEKIRNNWLKRH